MPIDSHLCSWTFIQSEPSSPLPPHFKSSNECPPSILRPHGTTVIVQNLSTRWKWETPLSCDRPACRVSIIFACVSFRRIHVYDRNASPSSHWSVLKCSAQRFLLAASYHVVSSCCMLLCVVARKPVCCLLLLSSCAATQRNGGHPITAPPPSISTSIHAPWLICTASSVLPPSACLDVMSCPLKPTHRLSPHGDSIHIQVQIWIWFEQIKLQRTFKESSSSTTTTTTTPTPPPTTTTTKRTKSN